MLAKENSGKEHLLQQPTRLLQHLLRQCTPYRRYCCLECNCDIDVLHKMCTRRDQGLNISGCNSLQILHHQGNANFNRDP